MRCLSVWFILTALNVRFALSQDTALQFILLGDWGDSFYNESESAQMRVAAAMDTWASREGSQPQFVITLGDNFYPDGVTSPTHEWFDTKWKWVYNRTNIENLPWYIALGNHDYDPLEERPGPDAGGREMNQVARSDIDEQWILPELWYSFRKSSPGGDVDFFVVDTNAVKEELNNLTEQVEWINTVIKASDAAVKLVIGHHPMYTIGGRAPGEETIKEILEPVLFEANVDAYFAGHEHNLQHIYNETETDPDHFIIGGGGRGISQKNPAAEILFNRAGYVTEFFYSYGFGVLTINETSILTQMFDDSANLLYEITRDIKVPSL